MKKKKEKRNEETENLISEYISCFETLDGCQTNSEDPITYEFAVGEENIYGFKRWEPLKKHTPVDSLVPIYSQLPAKFPPIYQYLLLNYRWPEVDLGEYRLLANPIQEGLSGLFDQMQMDRSLWDKLISSGFIQFGKGPDLDYDPVCFDISKRNKHGDFRIVKIDHEEILCSHRIREVAELAPSFEELAVKTIKNAKR